MDHPLSLEPRPVFDFFQEISAIPRGSGSTREISRYCARVAQTHGLGYHQDRLGNILIRRPADPGCEGAEPVILQAHLDMVWIRRPGRTEDHVLLERDGELLRAQGSTLGADDGIGVAYILALLTRREGRFPALEGLFTVDEETSMEGAAEFDVGLLQGRRMINLDSEEEGVLLVGSAGGVRLDASAQLPLRRRAFSQGTEVTLTLEGMEGGHSGTEIHKGRGNAIREMAGLLAELARTCGPLLSAWTGGSFSNAIPAASQCRFAVERQDLPRVEAAARRYQEQLRARLKGLPVAVSCQAVPLSGEAAGVEAEALERLLTFVRGVPDGVCQMDPRIPDMVAVSSNLGVLALEEGGSCRLQFALRSSQPGVKESLTEEISSLAKNCGFLVESSGDYPAWVYRPDSPLRDAACRTYERLNGAPMTVATIHAGTECSMFAAKLPELDCVSLGPDMTGIHSVEERLSIPSTRRVWDYLTALLVELGRPAGRA